LHVGESCVKCTYPYPVSALVAIDAHCIAAVLPTPSMGKQVISQSIPHKNVSIVISLVELEFSPKLNDQLSCISLKQQGFICLSQGWVPQNIAENLGVHGSDFL
jgi:hypothetical protein